MRNIDITEELIDTLRDDLFLLYNDFVLSAAGYRIRWAIDFSELFRYLHPVLDLLRTPASRHSQYLIRQFAIRCLVESPIDVRLVLPASLEEYRYELGSISERAHSFVDETRAEDRLKGSSAAHDKLREFVGAFSIAGVVFGEDEIAELAAGTADAIIYRREHEAGIEEFNRLMEEGHLRVISDTQKAKLAAEPSFKEITESIYGYLCDSRSLKSRSNRFDAQNCATLAILNRYEYSERRLYFMVTDAAMVRSKDMVSDLPQKLPVSEYGSRLPILRSLNYCLLRAYFRSTSDNFADLAKRVDDFRGFVANGKRILYSDEGVQSERDELKGRVGELLKEIMELHDWNQVTGKLSARIEQLTGLRVAATGTIDGQHLKDKFSKAVSDLEQVFSAYRDLEASINDIRCRLESTLRDSLKLVEPGVSAPVYGSYPRELYSEVDSRIVDQLDTIFRTLGSFGSNSPTTARVFHDVELLLQVHPDSPALHVAAAICSRRQQKFDECARQLDLASTLSPGNNEVVFQRAVLWRSMADVEPLPEAEKVRLLTEARSIVADLLRSDSPNPLHYQFNAYMIWRLIICRNPSASESLLEEDLRELNEAIEVCRAALRKNDTADLWNVKLQNVLLCDLSWYLAVSRNKKNVVEAERLIRTVPSEAMSVAQLDTKGYVLTQLFVARESAVHLGLLKEAIQTYTEALTQDPSYASSRDGLATTLKLFLSNGGLLTLPADLKSTKR